MIECIHCNADTNFGFDLWVLFVTGDIGLSEDNTLEVQRKFDADFNRCMAQAIEKIDRQTVKYFVEYCSRGEPLQTSLMIINK